MILSKDFNHSYWEYKSYFKKHDLIIIGSGIVGLSSAISFVEKNPKASVLIIERGILPNGASTKNAGFACFGSAGEILADLEKNSESTVWETVHMRWLGLQLLRKRLSDKKMGFQTHGGYELFLDDKKYQTCLNQLDYLNSQFKKLSGKKKCYAKASSNSFSQFGKVKGAILNSFEGQLDTGLLMRNLLQLAQKKGVLFLNQVSVEQLTETSKGVELKSTFGSFLGEKVLVATNGFASKLLNISNVNPARAQVLVTKPISNLKIKGTFHFDEGYYYFRNIDGRILFGGGRNLDPKTETTFDQGLNTPIQENLTKLLKDLILPGIKHEIEHRWSGIMGIGTEKKPIIQSYKKNTLISVRMGGMGVAIGTWVGRQAAKLLS